MENETKKDPVEQLREIFAGKGVGIFRCGDPERGYADRGRHKPAGKPGSIPHPVFCREAFCDHQPGCHAERFLGGPGDPRQCGESTGAGSLTVGRV